MERIDLKWKAREALLQAQMKDVQEEIEYREDIVSSLSSGSHGREKPRGPESLRFVEGNYFNGIVAFVILVNLITMTVSLASRNEASLCAEQATDTGFVVFYVVELALRWAYWQKAFLIGQWEHVLWNWLDLLLVIMGIIYSAVYLGEGAAAGQLQYLRVARYLRIARLVHTVWDSNLLWTEGDTFQSVVMGAILLNAIIMGAEVEYPDLSIWFVVEQCFLLFFTFELAIRMKYEGVLRFFTDCAHIGWNLLDLALVIGGIADQWVLPVYSALTDGGTESEDKSQRGMASVLRLVRFLRLLRVLRLLRLIKSIPPLYSLIIGILKAMQGMGWVMMLTVAVLYISALLGVKLVGPRGLLVLDVNEHTDVASRAAARLLKGHAGGSSNGALDTFSDPETQVVETCFPNMFDAMFNMFKVMQMDFESMDPLFVWKPLSKYIIMFYVVVTNWAIFSILTAVVSDEMAKVTNQLEEEELSKTKSKLHEQLVEKIFDRLSAHKHGKITRAQFEQLLQDPDEKEELCQAANLEEEDLKEFFELLCKTKDEEEQEYIDGRNGGACEQTITKEEFFNGLEKERDSVNQRAMMKLESRLDVMDKTIGRQIGDLRDIIETKLGMSVLQDVTPSAYDGSPRMQAGLLAGHDVTRPAKLRSP